MKTLLKELNACQEAIDWAADKSWEEIYTTCHRGDWLLWLFARTNPDDIQLLALVKGHCANTVRHLIKDEGYIKAIDAAIAFGEGKITKEELADTAYAAYAAYAAASVAYAAYAAASVAYAAYAAYAAASVTYAAASVAYAAYAAYDTAYDTAYTKNQQQTADICRKYLPMEVWNVGCK